MTSAPAASARTAGSSDDPSSTTRTRRRWRKAPAATGPIVEEALSAGITATSASSRRPPGSGVATLAGHELGEGPDRRQDAPALRHVGDLQPVLLLDPDDE